MRIIIYGGLLMIASLSYIARPPFGDSPLQAPELYSYTLKEFFSLEGFMKQLGKAWITEKRLRIIRGFIIVSWICCILGFGGLVPPVVVGLGNFVFHGIVAGLIGTSHRWYVPVYTLLALMFANGNQQYSLDSYFFHRFGSSYPFPPLSPSDFPLLSSGFSRKLILTSGIATLFFGGITKILNGGIGWLDGLSLAYYVSSEENGRSAILKNSFSKFRWFSLFLSVKSVGLELFAVVALFNPFARAFILFAAAGLHFGIWLTMWPNYFPQTFCYLQGINWLEENQQPFPEEFYHFSSSLSIASWFSTFLCFFLLFVTLFRIEYWPFTGIPMYSFYRDHTYDYKFLRDSDQAQRVALEHVNSQYPNALAWSNLWIILRLKNCEAGNSRRAPAQTGGTGESSESLFVNLKNRATDLKRPHGVLTKQWRRTLHNIAAVDMACKPQGAISDVDAKALSPGTIFPGESWLRENRAHLREYAELHDWRLPEWSDRSGELQLRCKLKEGYSILARVPWNPRAENIIGREQKQSS